MNKIKYFFKSTIKTLSYFVNLLISVIKKSILSTKIFLKSKINSLIYSVKKFLSQIIKNVVSIKLVSFSILWIVIFVSVVKFIERILNLQNREMPLIDSVAIYLPSLYEIVGTIFISLFIFIAAEGMRDSNEKYKLKILLQESNLVTIIILFLLWIIWLPFITDNIISFLFLAGFIFLGIYAIYKIISVILNPEELWKKRIHIFKKRIQEVTKFLIDIKLNNNKFLSEVTRENSLFKLNYSPFIKRDRLTNLKSTQKGTVVHIDLNKLKYISDEINKTGEKQGIYYSRPSIDKYERNNSDHQVKTFNNPRYFHILNGQEIKIGTPILSYDSNINININKENLQKQLNALITTEDLTVIDEARSELEDFKIMMKKFIQENNDFQFEKQFSLYRHLVEEFLKAISKHGQYSYQEAKRERNTFPFGKNEGWPLLMWLREHIIYLFKEAEEPKSDKIYEEIKWFSYQVVSLSQEKNDHLLFQEALSLWQMQLFSLDKENLIREHIDFFKKHVIDLIFRNTEQHRKGKFKKEKEGYAIYLLEIIKNLFEYTLGHKKYCLLKDLKELLEQITKMYDSEGIFEPISINFSRMDKIIFDIPESYESRKFQFLFGLGSYLENLQINDLTEIKETIKKVMPGIAIDLKDYIKVYRLMYSSEVRHFWNWEFFNWPKDAQSIDYSPTKNIRYYFLKLMSDMPQKEFETVDITQLDSNIFPTLIGCLSELETLDIDDDKKEILRKFFHQILNHQNTIRKRHIGHSQLEESKIQNFIQEFKKTFASHSYMRKRLFGHNNKIQFREKNKETDDSVFVINIVVEKANFISDDKINSSYILDVSSLASKFSGNFISSEHKFLQSEILKKCTNEHITCDIFKEWLLVREPLNNEILLLNNTTLYHQIISDPVFSNIGTINSSNSYLKIKNKKISLIESHIHQRNIYAILIDISKLPLLEIFNPIEQEKEFFPFQLLEDIGISIGIDAFSHNDQLVENMINNPPEWLTQIGNKVAQKEFLNQKVNIKIAQGIHLNWNHTGYIGSSFSIFDK